MSRVASTTYGYASPRRAGNSNSFSSEDSEGNEPVYHDARENRISDWDDESLCSDGDTRTPPPNYCDDIPPPEYLGPDFSRAHRFPPGGPVETTPPSTPESDRSWYPTRPLSWSGRVERLILAPEFMRCVLDGTLSVSGLFPEEGGASCDDPVMTELFSRLSRQGSHRQAT